MYRVVKNMEIVILNLVYGFFNYILDSLKYWIFVISYLYGIFIISVYIGDLVIIDMFLVFWCVD